MFVLRALVHSAGRRVTALPCAAASRRLATSYNSNLAGLTDEQREARHSLLCVCGNS
jgi:hypothetical protein